MFKELFSPKLFSLAHFPLENKRVFLRVDYNVPLEKEKLKKEKSEKKEKKKEKAAVSTKIKVADNTKIKASLQTINFLLGKNCKIILATHLGDPKGRHIPGLKTNPLADELHKLLPKVKIIKLDDCIGKEVKQKILEGKPKGEQKEKSKKTKTIFLLENLRFYKEEEADDNFFAHSLADLAEVYVNDAFGVSHRKHASVHAITKFLPSIPGFLLATEIKQLSLALEPKRPAIWLMGGAKLDKIDLIKQALKKADYILIGGALAFSFLKAKGINVGMSKINGDSVRVAKEFLNQKDAKKIILPVDFAAATTFSSQAKSEIVKYNQIKNNQICLDLGPETIKLFKHYLRKAHTIVWNGPLGYFEWAKFATATKEIGRFLGKLTAISICGGGETTEAIKKFYLQHNITHLSTGGGASLNFLAGKELPAISALKNSYKKFRRRIH